MPNLTIIVCYSPTSSSSEKAIDGFYADLQKAVDSVGRHAFLAILGDWNARLQKSGLSPWVFSNEPNKFREILRLSLCKFSIFCECCVPEKEGKALHAQRPKGVLIAD